jgi:hypothetical protein
MYRESDSAVFGATVPVPVLAKPGLAWHVYALEMPFGTSPMNERKTCG